MAMTVQNTEYAPPLAVGDTVKVAQYPSDTFTVDGFRAGGMLVDCIRRADGQRFCVPRRQDPGGWLRAQIDGYGAKP
jgi:hypothetical protein